MNFQNFRTRFGNFKLFRKNEFSKLSEETFFVFFFKEKNSVLNRPDQNKQRKKLWKNQKDKQYKDKPLMDR